MRLTKTYICKFLSKTGRVVKLLVGEARNKQIKGSRCKTSPRVCPSELL